MVGAGLAQDFRFTTRPAGREPRTAWGSELALSFGSAFTANEEVFDNASGIDGLPSLVPKRSKGRYWYKEKDRYLKSRLLLFIYSQ